MIAVNLIEKQVNQGISLQDYLIIRKDGVGISDLNLK